MSGQARRQAHRIPEELAERLRAGDPQAFAELYAALHGPLYSFLARLVGDRDDAADLVQDVFLAAFQQLPGHRGDLRPEPWLYRVAMNKAFDLFRRRRTRATVPLEEPAAACPVDHALASETTAAVEAALSQLPPRYRATLLLREVQGLDNRELASAMGVSAATAAVLVHRARAAFRRAYREVAQAPAAVAPGTLALALLPPLPVPPSLSSPPDFAALAATGAAAAGAAAVGGGAVGSGAAVVVAAADRAVTAADGAGGAAAAAGLLAKLGALASGKATVVAAAAALAVGGGIGAQELVREERPAPATPVPAASAQALRQYDGSSGAVAGGTTGEREHRALLAAARERARDGDGGDGAAVATGTGGQTGGTRLGADGGSGRSGDATGAGATGSGGAETDRGAASGGGGTDDGGRSGGSTDGGSRGGGVGEVGQRRR